jgi:hypothetical protein
MHPSEPDLLALIDGELEQADAASMQAHLTSCPACTARKAELETLVSRNRQMLAALDGDPPNTTADKIIAVAERRRIAAARGRHALVKAATIAILLATAAVAAAWPGSPVREAALRLVEGLRPGSAPEASRTSGIPAAGVAVQTTDGLVVAFAARQSRGTIEIVLEPTQTARIETSDPATSFSVASDSIAVDNAGSAASYVVTLPEALPSAEILVEGITVFRKTGESGPRTTIPFASIE